MAEEKKDVNDKTDDAFDAAKEKANDIGNKANEKIADAKEAASELADEVKEKASELGEQASETIEEFTEDAKEVLSDFAEDAKKTANEFSESAKEAFNTSSSENKKILAGILAIIFGWLGVHKFILGYQKEGIIMLVVGIAGLFLCGIPTTIVSIVGLIEGIMYLTKTDEEFMATYQEGRRPWF